MVFADVRGYTKLTEGLSPEQVPGLMNRFYETASQALLRHESLLGQVEGDNVMALFVPGLAGKHYRTRAVEVARSLLQAVDWLDLGVGISRGEEFGNVGGGAREILVDAATYETVADRCATAERRRIELKGKGPVETFAIPLD